MQGATSGLSPRSFGIALLDLPHLPFELPAGPAYSVCRWRAQPAEALDVDHIVAERDGVRVSWSGYASYDLRFDQGQGSVDVRTVVSPEEAAVAFVFSVLPLALPVVGIEPFHGSAVLTTAGAVLLLGASGAGKSSLAAALDQRGFPLLSDDTCALDESLRLWPGPPVLSPRWADAQQPPIGEYNEKPIRAPSRASFETVEPIATVCLIADRGERGDLSELSGADAFSAILANARHPELHTEERRRLQMRVTTHLAHTRVAALRHDTATSDLHSLADSISVWLEAKGAHAPVGAGTSSAAGTPA